MTQEELDLNFGKAAERGEIEALQALMEAGADIHRGDDWALFLASINGHLEAVKFLVERGAHVAAKDNCALAYAAKEGHLDVLEYLVGKGADIHALNNRAIIWAERSGHDKVVDYLFMKGDWFVREADGQNRLEKLIAFDHEGLFVKWTKRFFEQNEAMRLAYVEQQKIMEKMKQQTRPFVVKWRGR
jgi:ankyrin repeat protein